MNERALDGTCIHTHRTIKRDNSTYHFILLHFIHYHFTEINILFILPFKILFKLCQLFINIIFRPKNSTYKKMRGWTFYYYYCYYCYSCALNLPFCHLFVLNFIVYLFVFKNCIRTKSDAATASIWFLNTEDYSFVRDLLFGILQFHCATLKNIHTLPYAVFYTFR